MKCLKCAQARTVLWQFACLGVELSNEMPEMCSSSHCFAAIACLGVEHFRDKLEAYLKYSNEDRIKLKLDGMSPVQYRVHHQAKAS